MQLVILLDNSNSILLQACLWFLPNLDLCFTHWGLKCCFIEVWDAYKLFVVVADVSISSVHIPFDKDHLKQQILAGGGTFWKSLDSARVSWKTGLKELRLIEKTTHARTHTHTCTHTHTHMHTHSEWFWLCWRWLQYVAFFTRDAQKLFSFLLSRPV
jgi:hypothetical protein